MNDERPSAFYGQSSLGLTLLRAGRDERPSDDALARTLGAVGAGAAVVAVTAGVAAGTGATTSAVKGGVALVSFGSVMKWLGVGAVSGFVVAGVAHGINVPERASLEAMPPARIAPLPAAPAAPDEKPAPKAERASPEEERADAPKAAPPAGSAEQPGEEAPERAAPLAAEVALVDRARAALGSGNPGRALDELRRYETAFSEPRLLPEVLFLRMEAHVAAGDTARARAVAEESIRRFPRSPHAARARQLVQGNLDEKK